MKSTAPTGALWSLALTLVLALALTPAPATAKRLTLRTLDPATLASLAPLLERGELILIESGPDGRLKQGTLLALADATPKQVLDIAARPEEHPKFIPNLVRADLLQRDGTISEVAWELDVPFVNLTGVNRILDERPKTVRYWSVRGDIRRLAWQWEAVPVARNRSVVAHYTYSDIREASWFLRKVIAGRPTLEHGAVVSTGIVVLKAICDEAARRAGRLARGRPAASGRAGIRLHTISPLLAGGVGKAILPLLDRGEVAFVQSRRNGPLDQVVVLSLVDRPPEAVHAVAGDPARYAEFIPSVKRIEVTARSSDHVTYVNHLAVPLIDVRVLTEMRFLPNLRLALRILGGDVTGGRYAWEFLPVAGRTRTVALFYANTDVRGQLWFLQQLIEKEPYYEHGLNVGLGLVSVRAVRERAESAPTLTPRGAGGGG